MKLPNLGKPVFSHVYYYISQKKDKVLITIENEYDDAPLPGDDDFRTEWNRCIYIIVVTKDSIDLVNTVTDFHCNKTTEGGARSWELKSEYIEPYLGKNIYL